MLCNPETQNGHTLHDGARDFDPLFGNFTYRLRYIPHPLTGPTAWTELTGTGACYKVWNGRAQLDTIELDGVSGHIEGLALRLYDPTFRQWRLYWANSRIGRLDPPQIGAFTGGHGDFYTTDTISGKTILIRYDWSHMTSGTPHFEQTFSSDGGRTWDVNWITDQARTGDAKWGQPEPGRPSTPLPGMPAAPASTALDGQHDFDFDFGTWKMHIRRLVHPLTGSNDWTEMDGTTVTNKIWTVAPTSPSSKPMAPPVTLSSLPCASRKSRSLLPEKSVIGIFVSRAGWAKRTCRNPPFTGTRRQGAGEPVTICVYSQQTSDPDAPRAVLNSSRNCLQPIFLIKTTRLKRLLGNDDMSRFA